MDIKKLIFLIIWSLITDNSLQAQNQEFASQNEFTKRYERFEEELVFEYRDAFKTAAEIYKEAYQKQSDEALPYVVWFRGRLLMKAASTPELVQKEAYQLLEIYQQKKDSLSQLLILESLFASFYKLSYNDSASFYAVEMVKLAEQLKYPHLQAFAYLNLSNTYYVSRQHDKVKSYRKKAHKIGQENNYDDVLADVYMRLGQSKLRLSKKRTKVALDSVVFYLQKSVYYAEKANYQFARYRNLTILADILNISGSPQQGLKTIEKALDMPQSYRDSRYYFTTPFYYAAILKDNQQYSKAIETLRGLIKDLPKDDYRNIMSANYLMSVLYAYVDKPDSMDIALKRGVVASNANSETMLEGRVAEIETLYETEKKEQQLRELAQEKQILALNSQREVAELERQRLLLVLLVLAPTLVLAIGGWYVNRKRLRLKLETQEKERAQQLSELKALRSQMNPHFIFNALNSIQDFILMNDSDQAHHYLSKFAQLMRRFLNASQSELIPLKEELMLLKVYIELEALRLDENFQYQIEIDKKIDDAMEVLPPMLVQPYLENAFKHGLLHKKGAKELSLSFFEIWQEQERFLKITITDNGIGRAQAKAINQRRTYQHRSFATHASEQRLALLRQQTGRDIGIETTDLFEKQEPCGTQVEILFSSQPN